MASINEAYCEQDKRVLSIEEISNSINFEEIKHLLSCSTIGCSARLDFVNGQNENFLRTHRNENHLEECPHYFERNPTKLKSKKIGEVSVSIGEDESDTRLDYLYNSIYKKKTSGRTTPRTTTNRTTSNSGNEEDEHIDAVLTRGTGTEELSDLKEKSDVVVRGPKTFNRALNQVTDKDIFVKSYAYADSAEIKKELCEIKVHFGKKEGVFIFPDTFFSEYVQAQEFMTALVNYINLSENERYPVMLLVLAEVKEVSEQEGKQNLFVNKYPWLKIVIENSAELPPKLKLANFINMLNTGVFNKEIDEE